MRKLIAVMAPDILLCLLGVAALGKPDDPNRRTTTAVTLNRRAFEHAEGLIDDGRFVFDERDAWSENQPSAQQENEFIRLHGFAEYGKWYLESMTKNLRTPRDITNFHMGISKTSTAVASSPQKAAPANTSTMISRTRQRTCMAYWTPVRAHLLPNAHEQFRQAKRRAGPGTWCDDPIATSAVHNPV
jgi:hypothetical protein